MKDIFRILNPDNTMSFNRLLAHSIGLLETVMYCSLLSKYAYYEQHGMLDNGWFYSTAEDIAESTTLTTKQQRRCINNLEQIGLIRCEVRGLPAKRYFWLNDDVRVIEKLIAADSGKSSLDERAKLYEMSNGNTDNPNSTVKPNVDATAVSPVLPNGQTSFAETAKQVLPKGQNCSISKTKDNNLKSINLSEIRIDDIAAKYGESFAQMVEDVIECGLSENITCNLYGEEISPQQIAAAYKNITYDTICRVADYITERKNIRHIKKYLVAALYSAALEPQRLPDKSQMQSSIDMDMVMARLQQQYSY